MLTGGYSVNSCFYNFLNNGFAISNDARVADSAGNADPANDASVDDADPGVNSSIFADENSLYPSADCV